MIVTGRLAAPLVCLLRRSNLVWSFNTVSPTLILAKSPIYDNRLQLLQGLEVKPLSFFFVESRQVFDSIFMIQRGVSHVMQMCKCTTGTNTYA